ncbi:hypothetical protein B0I35DRAFT_248141 [Stachybotrys elegans]|uniref:Uncharacterized protein n=1 Tax=Stachybotrys elegans TaxID=80388 RepID=A0A8K0SSZ1_9HYPO|nr:hypothetical protein B0I35DRAFT_248141 [Stachybotrys elegans]
MGMVVTMRMHAWLHAKVWGACDALLIMGERAKVLFVFLLLILLFLNSSADMMDHFVTMAQKLSCCRVKRARLSSPLSVLFTDTHPSLLLLVPIVLMRVRSTLPLLNSLRHMVHAPWPLGGHVRLLLVFPLQLHPVHTRAPPFSFLSTTPRPHLPRHCGGKGEGSVRIRPRFGRTA